MTPFGIEPAIFLSVAQRLNHKLHSVQATFKPAVRNHVLSTDDVICAYVLKRLKIAVSLHVAFYDIDVTTFRMIPFGSEF